MKKFLVLILAVLILIALLILFITKLATKTGTAALSWTANAESDLAGYRIYYGTSPRTRDNPPANYPNKVDAGKTDSPDKPTYIVKNLEIGKTYYFSITSYDASSNESSFSPEISKTIK